MSKEKPNGYWNNYDRCYNEAKKYSTITDFAKGSGGAHHRAKANGWIRDYTWFADGIKRAAESRVKWNYETCYELAKQCSQKSEMKILNQRAYAVALQNGWFKDYTWLSRASHKKGYWTKEKCMEEAKKYTTRTEFQDKSPSAYSKAQKEKWLDDYTWFLNINTQWTYDLAFKEASKYKILSDFIKKAGGAYNASRRNNWIERFTWLKKKNISQKQIGQFTLDGKLVRMFNGAREASRITGISYSGISQCCNGKLRKHGGYIWKYISGVPRE